MSQPYPSDPSKPLGMPPPPQAPPQKSGCWKFLIVLLVLLIVAGICCCAGTIYSLLNTVTTSSAKVAKLQEEMIDMDIDPMWQPVFGMRLFPIAYTWMRMVMYQADGNQGILVIMSISAGMADTDEARRQMDQQMSGRMQGKEFGENVDVTDRGTRTFKVRGQDVEFTVNKAVGSESKAEYIEVSGLVQGKKHPTFIFLRAREDKFSEDQVRAMIESIR